jgi:hypothetical protein
MSDSELQLDQGDVFMEDYDPPACDDCGDRPPVTTVWLDLRSLGQKVLIGAYCANCAPIVAGRIRDGLPPAVEEGDAMSDRERAIARLMDEHAELRRGGFAIARSLLERAYDAGGADTAFALGRQTGSAIGKIIAERDRRVTDLEQLVRWMANTHHQAHHQDGEDGRKPWQECMRGFCSSVRRGLEATPARPVVPELDGLRARVTELEHALRRYGAHDFDHCSGPGEACTCGLDAALGGTGTVHLAPESISLAKEEE